MLGLRLARLRAALTTLSIRHLVSLSASVRYADHHPRCVFSSVAKRVNAAGRRWGWRRLPVNYNLAKSSRRRMHSVYLHVETNGSVQDHSRWQSIVIGCVFNASSNGRNMHEWKGVVD